MSYIYTFLILCWGTISVYGQVRGDDILVDIQNSDEALRDSLYYEMFRSVLYSEGELSIAKQYALEAYRLSGKHTHSFLNAKSGRALGMLYNRLGNPDSSQYYYYQSISISKNYNYLDLFVYATNDLGRHYENHDMYDSALKYYQVSLETARRLKMKEDMAFTLNNMGVVFYHLNNYKEALENLEAAVQIKTEEKINSLHLSLMNIALVYNDQGRYEDALRLLEEVESKYTQFCSTYQLAELYADLGYAHYHLEAFEKSYMYYQEAYKNAKESAHGRSLSGTLHYLGLFSLRQGNYTQAEAYLTSSLEIAQELNLRRTKRDVYLAFQSLYNNLNNLEKVIEYQNKYMAIKDSIFNEQMANNLKEIQLDAQRKQSEVIIQQKDVEIERVRLITALVGVISLLMIIVSFLIYRNYRASHRMKLVLEKEVDSRTKELVKSNQNLTVMTQEYDQLVYRASHDIRGPLATLMGLTNIAKQDTEEPLRVKDYLSKIESTAHGLSETLSQLMETNRIRNFPIAVEEINIEALVESLYSSFKTLNHFPLVSLRTEKGDWNQPLQSDKNLIAFVLTKLLDNAFRYFSVNKLEKYIKVSWRQEGDNTTIAVEDNGNGIDSNARDKIFQLFYVASDVHGSGLGLFLAQMAANRLGGRIVLARSSDPTIFKLVIPSNLANAGAEDQPLMAVS